MLELSCPTQIFFPEIMKKRKKGTITMEAAGILTKGRERDVRDVRGVRGVRGGGVKAAAPLAYVSNMKENIQDKLESVDWSAKLT